MDGVMSFAGECPERREFSLEAAAAKPAFRTDLFAVGYDLLAVWDMLTIGCAGLVCSVAYTRFLHLGHHLTSFEYDALRLSCIGALIAPLALRDSWARISCNVATSNQLISRTGLRVAILLAVLLVIGFVTEIASTLPRLWIAAWFGFICCTAIGGRLLLLRIFQRLAHSGVLRDRIAVLGSGAFAETLIAQVAGAKQQGVHLAAAVDDGEGNAAVLERSLARLIEMGKAREIDRVLLALPPASEARIHEVVSRLKALDVEVTFCTPLLGLAGGQLWTTQVAGVTSMVLTRRPHDRWGFIAKEIGDYMVASLLILATAPLLAAIAVLIRLDSPGPVIFRQRRHGCNGREFDVLKFRTMRWQGERAATGQTQTRRDDSRITPIGAYLRHTSLDELPQLFNVLNGTMSLVGPRPHPVVMRTEDRLGEEIIDVYPHRHRVKPGITGWAQVNGFRGATETAEQVRKRVEHDIYYIDNWSLFFDLRILIVTPVKILFSRSNAF